MPFYASRVRALCFDVDGTLRDTDDQIVARVAKLINPLRFILPQHNPLLFARRIVMGLEDPGTFLFGLPDRLNIDHYLAQFLGAFHGLRSDRREEFLLVEGVREMLEFFQPYYPMAIVSARGQRSTRAFLDHYGLTPFFKSIVTAQTCRHTKPYPDPVLWAAKKMGVHPSACLMIGDTTVDMRAGVAAGAQTVGVLCGFGEEEELRKTGADAILPATPDLVAILIGDKPMQ
jgi:phosphoglycolate phosphatase-like HAD superfamily hydrolase